MEIIKKLCDDIKAIMQEYGFDKFVLYTCDYNGWEEVNDNEDEDDNEDVLDDESELYDKFVEEADSAGGAGLEFDIRESFNGFSATHIIARKLRIKDDVLLFDVSEMYEDLKDNYEDLQYYKELTIEDILDKCNKEMVEDCLYYILHYMKHEYEYCDIIKLNKIMQHKD